MQLQRALPGLHDVRVGLLQRVDIGSGSLQLSLLEVCSRLVEQLLGLFLGVVPAGRQQQRPC